MARQPTQSDPRSVQQAHAVICGSPSHSAGSSRHKRGTPALCKCLATNEYVPRADLFSTGSKSHHLRWCTETSVKFRPSSSHEQNFNVSSRHAFRDLFCQILEFVASNSNARTIKGALPVLNLWLLNRSPDPVCTSALATAHLSMGCNTKAPTSEQATLVKFLLIPRANWPR